MQIPPYGVLDFDGPSVSQSKLGRLYLDQVGFFPGSLGNYGGVHRGVPVVTVERPNSTRTPLDAEMRQMWLDLLRWMSERAGERRLPSGPQQRIPKIAINSVAAGARVCGASGRINRNIEV